jgi:hypothetical protein
MRFEVLKDKGGSNTKPRIIELLPGARVLRTIDDKKLYKDIPFSEIVRIESSSADRCKLSVYRKDRRSVGALTLSSRSLSLSLYAYTGALGRSSVWDRMVMLGSCSLFLVL